MDVEVTFLGAVGPLVKNKGSEAGRSLVTTAVQESEKSHADKFIPDQLLLFLPSRHIEHGGEPQPLEILKTSNLLPQVLT